MAKRKRLKDQGGNYFTAKSDVEFFSSGCAVLDCVLGGPYGGWAERRVINTVGDKSSGKTLLAIEATANFRQKYKKGRIRYNEVEKAFDKPYAFQMGMPEDTEFVHEEEDVPMATVEDLYADLINVIEQSNEPTFYIVDSLDALSDKAEMERGLDQGTYGANKAKQLSQIFRRLNQDLAKSNVTVMVISQLRDKIGVTFGETQTRAGGRALDFYASQVLWLARTGKIKRTRQGVERQVGDSIRAKCKKNKVTLPFRECDFNTMFGFGIDDVAASVAWLKQVKMLDKIGFTIKQADAYLKKGLDKITPEDYREDREATREAIMEAWPEIESRFLPQMRKYG